MPCGGIYPMENPDGKTQADVLSPTLGGCWVCSHGGALHFMDEWDTYIHARCAIRELSKPDSDVYIVVGHGHVVELDFSLENEAGRKAVEDGRAEDYVETLKAEFQDEIRRLEIEIENLRDQMENAE
jgi:hypothetical protein